MMSLLNSVLPGSIIVEQSKQLPFTNITSMLAAGYTVVGTIATKIFLLVWYKKIRYMRHL